MLLVLRLMCELAPDYTGAQSGSALTFSLSIRRIFDFIKWVGNVLTRACMVLAVAGRQCLFESIFDFISKWIFHSFLILSSWQRLNLCMHGACRGRPAMFS